MILILTDWLLLLFSKKWNLKEQNLLFNFNKDKMHFMKLCMLHPFLQNLRTQKLP